MNSSIYQAAKVIKQEKAVIYPTETFFALGGMGTSSKVVERIRTIKGRPDHKPLPLVAGSLAQCLDYIRPDRLFQKIAEDFWPGPLSVLACAADEIPYGVKDSQDMVSIRVTPHHDAAELCLVSGVPLIATSANFSAKPSCASLDELDKELLSKASFVLDSSHAPAGGLPSTLVKIAGPGLLRVLRPGAVSLRQINEKGWEVENRQVFV